MNLIHEIDPGNKEKATVIIEIPRHSRNKYEIDKKTGLIALDRALHTAQDYPVDYGFIPQTLWYDDDPLDCIVLTTFPLSPGIVVRARFVGLLKMIDDGDSDDKVIAVPTHDPRWDKVKDIEDINSHTLKEVAHFFETYKGLQDVKVEIKGYQGANEAREAFDKAREMYEKAK